nr:hypothetical protein [Nocardioides ungokensis]
MAASSAGSTGWTSPPSSPRQACWTCGRRTTRGWAAAPVEAFLGHAPGPGDAPADPQQQVPLDVPVCVRARRRRRHRAISQSRGYVAAATAAGARAELVEVEGDHFTVIDTGSDAWKRTLAILDSLA